MKLIITTGILLSCNLLYSQWAPVGAKWYYGHFPQSPNNLTVIESVKDTLILNKNCKELISFTIYAQMHPNGSYTWDTAYCLPQYIYDDSNRVFVYDSTYNSFYMLYDFNADAGDTITVQDSIFYAHCNNTFPYNVFQYRINSVNDTIINGISLKAQTVSTTQNSEWYITDPYNPQGYYPIILEKIGSFKFLFGVGDFVEGSVSYLRCYEDTSISYHAPDWPNSSPCNYLYTLPTVINNAERFSKNIDIFPNPLTYESLISLPEYLQHNEIIIDIFDVQGRLIKNLIGLNSNQLILKRRNFGAAGMYFMLVRSGNYLNSIKLFVQ